VLNSLVACVVIMNILITAVFAWITLNRMTYINNMGMALEVDDTRAIYKAYMYDLENEIGTDQHPEGGELNISNIDLNPYDTIFHLQNKYTPAFARIEIFRNLSMDPNGTVYITISRKELEGVADWPVAYSSSIIRFTAFIFNDQSDRSGEIKTADDLYNFINTDARYNDAEQCVDSEASKTFVTHIPGTPGVSEDSHTKSDTITISVDYTADAWHEYENGDKGMYVYLYMSYDPKLIECHMRDRSGGSISINDNTIFFENDFDDIKVSYTNKEE
jgi:hypothetical protein